MMDVVMSWSWSVGAVVVLVAVLTGIAAGIMAWWEFYGKPVRDSLRSIDKSLRAAPWLRQASPAAARKSA